MTSAVATPKVRGDRTPRAELEQRLSLVEDLVTAGMPARKICDELQRQRGWPQTTVYRYVQQVRRRWLAEHEAERETATVTRIARLQSLSFKAERKEAWAAVGRFETLLCQIHGVLAPERHDHRVAAIVAPALNAAPERVDYEALTSSLSDEQMRQLKEIALAVVTTRPATPALLEHDEDHAHDAE